MNKRCCWFEDDGTIPRPWGWREFYRPNAESSGAYYRFSIRGWLADLFLDLLGLCI